MKKEKEGDRLDLEKKDDGSSFGVGGFSVKKKEEEENDPSSHLLSLLQAITTTSASDSSRPSGPNVTVPPPPQLTLFYSGTVSVFNAVPAETAQAIMFIASVAAATTAANNTNNTMNGSIPSTPASPLLTRSPSLQSTAAVEASPLSQFHSVPNPSLCKLQSELPIARRHSLQRFLEKRRDRLVSKSPYPPSTPMKVADTTEASCSAEASTQLGCFAETPKSQEGLPPPIPAHLT